LKRKKPEGKHTKFSPTARPGNKDSLKLHNGGGEKRQKVRKRPKEGFSPQKQNKESSGGENMG